MNDFNKKIWDKCFCKSLKIELEKETSLFLTKFQNFYLNVSEKK